MRDAGSGREREQAGAGADVEHPLARAQARDLEDVVSEREEPGAARHALEVLYVLIPVLLAQPAKARSALGRRSAHRNARGTAALAGDRRVWVEAVGSARLDSVQLRTDTVAS